jgi:hypothetical protein
MSAWPGKYVIGLTGNIATGKSVVRKMLEHLGAYGIDADALGHRAIAKDAPGYQAVLNTFGKWILAPDEQIDRAKLGGSSSSPTPWPSSKPSSTPWCARQWTSSPAGLPKKSSSSKPSS